ncbi:MAG: TIGR04348 family glycosyltransferase [Rhodospirillaceae bacterium]|nr:TIGR04348 family glycosyltransferase [Rhodospirillaceae bacterium]|tara:strand:+ start:15089 stop:16042 length:954 start_codon:yes stop_codon:yes gene_type:complete
MKISLVTPAGKQSKAGNRRTAIRWARILRELGHKVKVSEQDNGRNADMMIAVHAWRSRHSIRKFNMEHPDRPLIVLLAGTDIYKFQHSHREETYDSMHRATALVCLHDLVSYAIPKHFKNKLNLIYQSSHPLRRPRIPSKKRFEVCVVGHLREEKDSLRAALATHLVQKDSNLYVVHLGKASNMEWEQAARNETANNHRYEWRGEVSNSEVRRQFSRSHAMIISSIMEGGANVVSEAVVCGLPIIASNIDGNIGLLGDNYAGYYEVKDENQLAHVLEYAENSPNFIKKLERQILKKKMLFSPTAEIEAWEKLIKRLL